MNEEHEKQPSQSYDDEGYEPPAIVESARFESVAAACIYAQGQGSCIFDPSLVNP